MNLRDKRLKILALKVLKATKGEISESFSCMVQKSKWRLTFCLTPWTDTELSIQYITTWLTSQTCNVSNDPCSSKCSSYFCEYFKSFSKSSFSEKANNVLISSGLSSFPVVRFCVDLWYQAVHISFSFSTVVN